MKSKIMKGMMALIMFLLIHIVTGRARNNYHFELFFVLLFCFCFYAHYLVL